MLYIQNDPKNGELRELNEFFLFGKNYPQLKTIFFIGPKGSKYSPKFIFYCSRIKRIKRRKILTHLLYIGKKFMGDFRCIGKFFCKKNQHFLHI